MKTQIDALHKFQNQLLSTFNAQDLTYFKRSGWNGMLENIDRLYATMLHDWDVLQKDTDSIEKAVRSLDWSLSPYVKKGEKVSAQAQQVAQVVEDALWRRTPQKLGTYAHSFIQLLGAIVHAEFRGQNVHRIVWQNDGKLIYPAAFVQLPPQFLRWEVEPGKPDLLLHVPDGEMAAPVPFKPYQFIVALNNAGPDHPLYNATYYGLVAWFSAAKNGLGWFMQYAEQHHLPKPVFHYDNDEDREQLIRDLQQDRVINAFLLYGDRQVEWASASTGTTMPQKELLELAEAHCHKAMLGQTLTSDTSKSGGSLAQAKVHAGVQADEVMKHAEFVADVINRQLIPAIVHLNFGKVEGMPLPELRFKLPQAAANIERAQFWSQVMAIPGMSVVKSEVYDSLGIAMPSDDDEVLETPSQQDAGLAGMLQGFGQEPPAGSDEVALAARTRNKQTPLPDALKSWLAPIKKKLIEARKAGASFEELREQMRSWMPDTRALAGAFAENVEAGLRGEGDVDNVEAANPYGCNQYGHGYVEPCNNGGNGSTSPMGTGGSPGGMFTSGPDEGNVSKGIDADDEKKKEEELARKESEHKAAEEAKRAEEEKARNEEVKKNRDERIKAAKTPSEFVDALGLSMTEDASEEQIGDFMQQLKNRHPENKKHVGRLFNFALNENTTSSQKRIIKVMEEVVSMMNPEIVRGLTSCSVNVRNLSKNVGGQYSSKRIEYNVNPDKKCIMHEFIHHVHDSSTDKTYDRLSDYFRERTKSSIVQTLSLSRGYADRFAVSFDRYNDYAGTIYDCTERRVTGSKYGGPTRKRQDNRNGVEMATTHLEKLQEKTSVFMRYWNDKQNGRYYWREAFMESMNLFFKK